MTTAKAIFALLQGVWKMRRTIIHNTAPFETYEGAGSAEFSLSGAQTLLYHENLKLQNLKTLTSISGQQKYQYRYDADKDEIIKYFSDRRLFYYLALEAGQAQGEHLCAKDNYRANYQFISEKCFTLKYEVKGPEKDYSIFTEYTKLAETNAIN